MAWAFKWVGLTKILSSCTEKKKRVEGDLQQWVQIKGLPLNGQAKTDEWCSRWNEQTKQSRLVQIWLIKSYRKLCRLDSLLMDGKARQLIQYRLIQVVKAPMCRLTGLLWSPWILVFPCGNEITMMISNIK